MSGLTEEDLTKGLIDAASMVKDLMDRMTSDRCYRQEDGWHVLIIRDLDQAGVTERCEWCKEMLGPRHRKLLNANGTWSARKSKDRGLRNSAYEFRFRDDAWAMFRLRWL